MSFVPIVIRSFSSLVMIQKERVIRMREHDIFSQKRRFYERMICIYFLKNIVIPMHKTKLTITFTWWLIVEIESILSHQHIVTSQFVYQFTNCLKIILWNLCTFFNLLYCYLQLSNSRTMQSKSLTNVEIMTFILQSFFDLSWYL